MASGIIAAVLAFYPTIAHVTNLQFLGLSGLSWSLIFLGLSILAGLVCYATLISAIEENAELQADRYSPIDHIHVTFSVSVQIITFGLALLIIIIMIITIHTPVVPVAKVLVEDASQALGDKDSKKALIDLLLAQDLAAGEQNETLKVYIDNALQALSSNNATMALNFLKPVHS